MPRKTLGWLVLTLVLAGCRKETPAPAASSSAPPRVARDVVLITIDTLRYDAVGFNGNTRGTTPNLDRFAAEGRVFSQAHSHNVITLPSHTNILTGMLPYQHGVRENAGFRLSPKVPTVATRLKAKGYATGAFVGAYVLDSRYGLAHDFDVYTELYRHLDEQLEFKIQQARAEDVVKAALEWFGVAAGQAAVPLGARLRPARALRAAARRTRIVTRTTSTSARSPTRTPRSRRCSTRSGTSSPRPSSS